MPGAEQLEEKNLTQDKIDYEKADFDSIPKFPQEIDKDSTAKVNRIVEVDLLSAPTQPKLQAKTLIVHQERSVFEEELQF